MRLAFLFFLTLVFLPLFVFSQDELSLAGKWDVAFDTNLDGGAHRWLNAKFPYKMPLPGTTDEAGLGDSLTLKPSLEREALYQLAVNIAISVRPGIGVPSSFQPVGRVNKSN